jgi:HindVP restriction endonuclease
MNTASLFGLTYSNRDFSQRDSWGKNQFNSSFPASLAAYLHHVGLPCIYLKLNNQLAVYHDKISTMDLYGVNPVDDGLFYAFESPYLPFQPLVMGHFPRVDLVMLHRETGECLRGLEVKLTALPDNSTCELPENKYGCELVIRPDTIVYLACSLAMHFRHDLPRLRLLLGDGFDLIEDWQEGTYILQAVARMTAAIDRVALSVLDNQEPLVMQPVWKTEGKNPRLADNCLDVFVWSNLAFTQLFLDVARREIISQKTITRQVRTAVWLFKMLYDFSLYGRIDHRTVIDGLSYNTKNDKAFAVSGRVTHPYMNSPELTKPRISKHQIKDIILGGGQDLLSPERRFDAIIFNSPELFG